MKQQKKALRPVTKSRGRSSAIVAVLAMAALALSPSSADAQLNQTLHDDGWILAAAHAPGHQGSIWRTDLWVHFDTYTGGTAELYFCRQGQDNSSATPYIVEAVGGETTIYIEDVVDHYLDVGSSSWVGAIHYVANRNVQVYARVYSISADGSRSYGQLIEGIPTADMTISFNAPGFPSTDENQWLYATKHTADGRFRVNVGAVNPTAVASRVYVNVYVKGNKPPGFRAVELDLPPFSMQQLEDPFADLNGGEWNNYTIRLETREDGSGVFGYASVVDNATNDAYFIRGVKRMTPDR